MPAITIDSKSDDLFVANGFDIPRVYEAVLSSKESIDIISAHRSQRPLFSNISFADLTINGVIPTSNKQAVSLINAIVFKKGGSTGEGVAKSNYDLWLEDGNTGTLTEFLESLKSPRLLEIETETEATLIFNETSPSEIMTRVDNSTTTSVPVTLSNTIPVGWSKVMRQAKTGVFNFVEYADITIIKRDGLLLQTVKKMDTVHILCVAMGVFEIDGDLKPE